MCWISLPLIIARGRPRFGLPTRVHWRAFAVVGVAAVAGSVKRAALTGDGGFGSRVVGLRWVDSRTSHRHLSHVVAYTDRMAARPHSVEICDTRTRDTGVYRRSGGLYCRLDSAARGMKNATYGTGVAVVSDQTAYLQ